MEGMRGEVAPTSGRPATVPSHLGPSFRQLGVARYVPAVELDDVSGDPVVDGPSAVAWREPLRLDVLDPRGAYLGSLTFPVGSRFMAARGADVWIVEQGALDEEYLVRYRVREWER